VRVDDHGTPAGTLRRERLRVLVGANGMVRCSAVCVFDFGAMSVRDGGSCGNRAHVLLRSLVAPVLPALPMCRCCCRWDPAPYFAPDNYFGSPEVDAAGTAVTPGVSLNMLCLPALPPNGGASSDGGASLRLAVADVLNQLKRADPARPHVEAYNPLPARADSGFVGTPREVWLKMAEC